MIIHSIYWDEFEDTFTEEGNEEDFDFFNVEQEDIERLVYPKALWDLKETRGTYYFDSDDPFIQYELVFPLRDDIIRLEYDSEDNVIYNEDGSIVYTIFMMLTPNELSMFKRNKKTLVIHNKHGQTVELSYN